MESPPTKSCRLNWTDWLLILLGSVLLLANLHAAKPLMSANDRSRWATVWSLVERGTYQIDEIDAVPMWSTIDKVLHEGHLYSSKPPLLSTIAAGIYWGLKQTAGYDLRQDPESTTHAILLLLNGIPMVLSFIVFACTLKRVTDHAPTQSIALAIWCFGTLVTGYATTFNNHSLGAVCLAFALGPLINLLNFVFRPSGLKSASPETTEKICPLNFVSLGFWTAAAVCCELPAALLGAIAFLVAARANWRQTLLWFAPAALVPFAAYFVTNAIATGGWKPFYTFYGTEKYLFTLHGIPSYWLNPRGLDRNIDGPVMYFFHCVVGHHGIFSLSPILLLMPLTWCKRSWWRATSLAPFMFVSITLSVAVLGFYLTRTANYNYGGNTYGLRWIIWLSPMWIISLVPALEKLTQQRRGMWLILGCLAVSAYSAQASAKNPWGESWLFHRLSLAGWIDYSDPSPELPYQRPIQTWFPELPGDDHSGGWIEFESVTSAVLGSASTDILRVSDRGTVTLGGRSCRKVSFEWNPQCTSHRTLDISLDTAAFESGKAVEEMLMDFEATPKMSKSQVVTFLRGLPYPRTYHGGSVRYLKTVLRDDAFQCYRAAVQVVRRLEGEATQTDRCDVWLSPEVPFGVLQFEINQFDTHSDNVTKRRFVARRISKP